MLYRLLKHWTDLSRVKRVNWHHTKMVPQGFFGRLGSFSPTGTPNENTEIQGCKCALRNTAAEFTRGLIFTLNTHHHSFCSGTPRKQRVFTDGLRVSLGLFMIGKRSLHLYSALQVQNRLCVFGAHKMWQCETAKPKNRCVYSQELMLILKMLKKWQPLHVVGILIIFWKATVFFFFFYH